MSLPVRERNLRFEELGEFERELLAEAYRHQQTQRLRALIGVPVCVAISILDYWFFMLRDDSGAGGLLGWPVLLVVAGIGVWMLLETIANRRVRWVLRSLNLQKDVERELVISMKRSPLLAAERARSRSTIGDELKEGSRRIRRMRSGLWPGD